jgi:hypothetical protein
MMADRYGDEKVLARLAMDDEIALKLGMYLQFVFFAFY